MSYIEEAIQGTGWGLYSKFLVGFTALCSFCNGMSFIILPLYIPILRCDLPLNESMINFIDICIPIGYSLGGFLFSAIGDVVGRKSSMNSSLLITFIGILSSCFAYNGGSIIISVLLLGTGISTSMIMTRIHIAESLAMKYRGRCIILLDIFWILGNLVGIILFVIIMPVILKYKANNIRIISWRYLYGLSAIFIISLACTTALILPSSRFLLYEKRSAEAAHILKQIFAVNTSKIYTNYGITEADLHGKIADFGINSERDIPNNVSARRCGIIFRRIHKGTMMLLRKKFVCSMFLVFVLRLTTCIGLFLLTMLFVKTLHFTSNCRFGDLKLQHFQYNTLTNCNDWEMEIGVYKDYLILSLFIILGHVLACIIINHVEKKYIIGICLFLSGGLLILLSFIKDNYLLRFLISSFVLFCFAICESFLNIVVIEIFPTAVRGTAFGETLMFPGIIIMLLEKYLPILCSNAFFGLGALFQVGALFSFLIPKLKNKPMVD